MDGLDVDALGFFLRLHDFLRVRGGRKGCGVIVLEWAIEGIVEGFCGYEFLRLGQVEVVVGGVADGDHLAGVCGGGEAGEVDGGDVESAEDGLGALGVEGSDGDGLDDLGEGGLD